MSTRAWAMGLVAGAVMLASAGAHADVAPPPSGGAPATGGAPAATGGAPATGGGPEETAGAPATSQTDDSGCSLSAQSHGAQAWAALLGLALLGARRTRPRR